MISDFADLIFETNECRNFVNDRMKIYTVSYEKTWEYVKMRIWVVEKPVAEKAQILKEWEGLEVENRRKIWYS